MCLFSIRNSHCKTNTGDFIIQRDGKIIPIEVKSADNTKAKSLKFYIDTYKPEYAIIQVITFRIKETRFHFFSYITQIPVDSLFLNITE